MSSSTENNFPPLDLTYSLYNDIVRFLDEGNIVSIYSEKFCQIYHTHVFDKPEDVEFLKGVRVIYIDFTLRESIFEGDFLNNAIKSRVRNVHELGLDSILRKAIMMHPKSIPNQKYIKVL